jgi:hypothetical protein
VVCAPTTLALSPSTNTSNALDKANFNQIRTGLAPSLRSEVSL